jgi:putative chitinase
MPISKINRKFFFDDLRKSLFKGSLKASQVEGMNFIVDVWEANHEGKDDRWLAYALGTSFHETATTMQPIKEFGSRERFMRLYDKTGNNPNLAKRLGNTVVGDGALFAGRGYVQLTGRGNYNKMGKAFDVDLTSSEAAAKRVMQAELASKIMFKGMEDGDFTGKRLANFFTKTKTDWVNARKIINGLDKAEKIAGHAIKFVHAIIRTP